MLLLLDHPVRRNDLDGALPVPAIHQRRSQDQQRSARAVASLRHVTFATAWSSTRFRLHLLVRAEGERHVPSRPLTSAQVLTMLAATPPRIAALTAGLAPAQLQAAPVPGEWSANEVLAHLRACVDMWGNYIAEIIAHDHPTLRAVNPRTWIDKTDYREQAFQASLHAFTVQRADLLAVLELLAPEGWARAATVTGAGAVLERTVLFYARWLAGHERPHVKQIERIAKTIRT
jgi:hypothetical protein